MNIDVNVKELNTKDPLLAEWALLRIDYLQYIDKEEAERFAEEFFHKESVRYLLETSDFTLLSLLLSFLDAKKFEDNIHILKNKWNEWPDVLAFETAAIIAKNSPQEAYGFFLENFPGIDDDEFNIEKFSAILRAIEYIQEEHARDLADRLISGYIRATDPFKSVLQLRVMEVAWKYEHPAFYDLFHSFFLENTFEDEDYCKPFLLSLADMFSVSGEDFNTIYEYYYENIEPDYQDLKIFFKPFAPLEEIEKILKSLNRGKHEKVRDFCRKWLHVLSGEKLKGLFERFLNDNDFIKSIEEEMTLPLFYILLLSILIASMREKEVSPEGLSVQEVIEAISLDIVEVPSFHDFADYLKKKDKKEVIECILAELEKEDYWSLHTVRMMGELLYSEFIPHLLYLLSYDEISYIAAEALEKYGDSSYDYIEKKIFEMDKDGRDGALSVISKMDNYRVKRFVLDNFSLLFLKNKSRLLSIIDVYPDKIFIEKLKPFIDKGQLSIEHTYVILNKLYGLEGEEIALIEKRIYEHNRDMEKIQEAMDEENIIDTIKPYLDVELNCGVCGDESYYRLQDIKVNFSDEESMDASLSEKITCVNCNSSQEFGITADGMDIVMSEVMKFAMLGSEEDRKRAVMKSPVTVISGLEGDEDINIFQSLEYYEKEIKENPGDVSNYIYAGNIYRNTGRYLKAEEFYKKSIEIDPSSAEVYYALADIAARRDEYKDALEWLTGGREYVDKVKYREDFEGSKGKFIRSYNEFYQEMLEKSASNQEPSAHVRSGDRAGRNSPCPCGSGKKYKKCCLNK